LQKWIALIHIDGQEAWSEYRKASGTTSVGVPASVRTTSGAVTSAINEPVRFIYPQIVYDANGANVPAITYNSKIFWDVN
jgi:Tfp pilus assembly protein PilX